MLDLPQLTVIMPVYNVEKYIGRALEALLNQKNRNFKLLIVNDGYKDKTRQIAESYSDKFLYFKLINKANEGVAAARNVALAHVDTPYFTFHDGDDWVDPDYTDFFINSFKRYPHVSLISCGYWIDKKKQKKSRSIDPKRESGHLTKKEAYFKIANVSTSPVKGYTWNKCYRLDVVRKHNIKFMGDIAFMEDEVFNIEYVSLSDGVYFTSKPYYHYWQRPDSLIHVTSGLKYIPDNVRATYRVWHKILKSLRHEKKKIRRKIPNKITNN